MQQLTEFRTFLISHKSSPITVKNYLSDINSFLRWLETTIGINYRPAERKIFSFFTAETLAKYQQFLMTAKTPRSTINRRLSALRRFGDYAVSKKLLTENPTRNIPNYPRPISQNTSPIFGIMADFKKKLDNEKISPISCKNYLSDIRHFIHWLESTP